MLVLLGSAAVAGQAPVPAAPAAAGDLAEGWSALATGDLAKAARAAERAMSKAPLATAPISLAVEIEVARGGPLPGLDVYERWLATRKVDDPYTLRRIANAHLRWVAVQSRHLARLEAARALVADGDQEAAADLMRGAAKGGPGEAQMLAAVGDPRGVEILIGQLNVPGGRVMPAIKGLAESGSRLAVAPLVARLDDPREDHRAAAADALGRLGATDAIARIKPLLNDPTFPVRMAAASALYRLEDYSGVDLLDQLLTSEHAAVRLSAAEAMAVRPSQTWHTVVRSLALDSDSTVQLGAARLLAPYDPDTAAAVLERLRNAENPAIREEAGRAFVQRVAGDFASLRRYLRSPDALTGVRAASRILELTR